jgi:hypothetical protein
MEWVFQEYDEVYTYGLDESITLKLYPDNRPFNLEASMLHKGIVLEYNGAEKIGEGMGFGVPVVKYRDKTFFSGSSTIFFETDTTDLITKIFTLDKVSKKYYKSNQISDKIYQPFHRVFTFLYLRLKPLRFLFDHILNIRENMGVYSKFIDTEPRGIVSVSYLVRNGVLMIKFDFSGLDLDNCEEFVILNEQGALFFDTYRDSSGVELSKENIGAWEKVSETCSQFEDKVTNLRFELVEFPETSLFRGWENIQGRLSWAGLNYTTKPDKLSFSYSIKIQRNSSCKAPQEH